MKNLFLLFSALVLLNGCSVMAMKKHQPNFKNVRELESAKGSFRVEKVIAGNPEMEQKLRRNSLTCRLASFNTPANTNVAKFIDDALTDELDAAKKISDKGSPFTIKVNELTSDTSGFNKGTWTLDFDYLINNKTINVKTVTEFESAYSGDTACRNTASALTDALTDNFVTLYKKLPKK